MFDARIFPDRHESTMDQPTLYEQNADDIELETVLLYALGDFQSRGHQLAGRELALDRLHGAFLRACERYGIGMPEDKVIADELISIGADVIELPRFMAKRPFRITVSKEIADKAETFFKNEAS